MGTFLFCLLVVPFVVTKIAELDGFMIEYNITGIIFSIVFLIVVGRLFYDNYLKKDSEF